MHTWVVSTLGILWIMLLWTFMYKFFCRHMFSFLMIIYLWKYWVIPSVYVQPFEKLLNCFPMWLRVSHSQQQCMRISVSPNPHQHVLLFFLLILAILVDMKWYLTVVLICISLVANDVELHFVCFFGHFYIFDGEISIQMLFPFLNWIIISEL